VRLRSWVGGVLSISGLAIAVAVVIHVLRYGNGSGALGVPASSQETLSSDRERSVTSPAVPSAGLPPPITRPLGSPQRSSNIAAQKKFQASFPSFENAGLPLPAEEPSERQPAPPPSPRTPVKIPLTTSTIPPGGSGGAQDVSKRTGLQQAAVVPPQFVIVGTTGTAVTTSSSGGTQGFNAIPSASSSGGPSSTGGGTTPQPITATVVQNPPRFREQGIAIGDALEVLPAPGMTFPLTLHFPFDPTEVQAKGVSPELIQAFYFNAQTGQWSTDGLSLKQIDVSGGMVDVETTHLTVFRLGIPRGQPPLLAEVRPHQARPGDQIVLLGKGLSSVAAQNLLTLGGAYVLVAVDAAGQPQSLNLRGSGDTLVLTNAGGLELDRANLPAAPEAHSSWTRQLDGDSHSPFVDHTTVSSGRLLSPGTMVNGQTFPYVQGSPVRPPAAGELIINEALLTPPSSYLGDANGDGETNGLEDEFVEFVNTTTHPLDLSGCQLSTSAGVRHQFPSGTILPGGMSIVVFGVDDPAHPPQPAMPFGGLRFFPDASTPERVVARLPDNVTPGTVLLTLTRFRQTSNPLSLQVLSRLSAGQGVAMTDGTAQLPSTLAQRPFRLIRSGDLNRDLAQDLVAVEGETGIAVLLNDGVGGFSEAPTAVPLPVGRNHFFDLALVDLTEDGAPELLVGDTDAAGSYTQLLVFQNNGGGMFTLLSSAGALSSQASAGPTAFAVGDVNGDGSPDVVVAMMGEAPAVFLNDGQGHFTLQLGTGGVPQQDIVIPTHIALADFNNDGHPDIVLTAARQGLGQSSALQLFLNDGQGHFTDATATHLPHVSEGIDALAIGDVTGDGNLDVLVGNHTGAVRVFLNDGTGMFTESTGRIAAQQAQALALADLNDDGSLDAIVAKPPRDEAYLNDGAGHFSLAAPLPALAGDHDDVLPVDVDRDGDVDLFGAGPGLTLLLNAATRINHPPQLGAVNDQSATVGTPLQFDVQATDVDGDSLTLTASVRSGESLASLGASFTDHGNGRATFSWTPTPAQGSRGGHLYELVVDASDGLASGEITVRMTVHQVNHPPTLAPIAPVTIDELTPLTLQLQASDSDAGDVLTFGAVGLPTGATLGQSTGLFQWTPDATQGNGPSGQLQYPITFTVTDLAHATASQPVTITVQNKNHAPQFTAVGPQQVAAGEEATFPVSAGDPDGDAVTLTMVQSPPDASFDTAAKQFHWTPSTAQIRANPYVVKFEASDGTLTATLDVPITVIRVNHPPMFVGLSDRTVDEGQALDVTIGVVDIDGDALTVSVVGALPTGATLNPATRQLHWVPDFTQAGIYTVQLRVSDGLASAKGSIQVTVVNVARSPVLAPIPDQRVREGELLQFPIQVSDPDGNPVTVTVVPLPAGAQVIHQGAPYVFQWVPGMDQQGTYQLEVHASDGQLEVVRSVTITVIDNPAFQPLLADVGLVSQDTSPAQTPVGRFGEVAAVTLAPGDSLGLDFGAVHPAAVSTIEVFDTALATGLNPAALEIWVSDDNVTYRSYGGSFVALALGNRMVLSNLQIPQRFIKVHWTTANGGGTAVQNFLPQVVRASGVIVLDAPSQSFLEDLAHRSFNYFAENVNSNGLIPDRVIMTNGQPTAGIVYSTAATGFWLASLPIAVEHGWLTRNQAETLARRTLNFYLGLQGGPVAGQFGFFYHFLNGDGTRFTGFGDDGVSILDSSLLFLDGLASGEYFGGDIRTLSQQLYDHADWEAFFDHGPNQAELVHGENEFHLVWTPERGFERHLDYYSEGILSYVLAAGSTTHPVRADPNLPNGLDAYYTFSRGNFGRVLGRFGREGRPLLQSFFGSLFTYLFPPLFTDLNGRQDAFNTNLQENTREAILANFRFAQAHPEFNYSRLFWGISAADGPSGYQGRYGTPPLDPAANGELHDGTISPSALAGSLPFAADLALPALMSLRTVENGAPLDLYGFKDGVNGLQHFVSTDYLGIDQGTFLLGLEQYRSGLIGQLTKRSAVLQQALTQIGFGSVQPYQLVAGGPRGAHAYVFLDTTDHLTQTVQLPSPPATPLSGDFVLELHPYGIDNALAERFVDVDVSVNGQFLKTVRFQDRRSDGVVDVGSVYVAIPHGLLSPQQVNTLTLTWVGGERWVQLQDIEVDTPTGRQGTQETWQIGQRDGSYLEFGDERLVNDSYLVGDSPSTFEKALNVVDEPRTDILFELSDLQVDRRLHLVASETQNNQPVTVEVSLNNAVAGQVTLHSGEEATVDLSHTVLRPGWNQLTLRHANVPGDGQFILWDTLVLERQTSSSSLAVIVRNTADDQLAPEVQFGLTPPDGAVIGARQYLEIQYTLDAAFDRLTIETDNRNAPIHRFTGPSTSSAAGLVGVIDSTVTAPLLWQVYASRQSPPPVFTNTTDWAYVSDTSESNFTSPEAIAYRTLVSSAGLGERPTTGRSATTPIYIYLVGDFQGKPAQMYGTDRLLIERIEQ